MKRYKNHIEFGQDHSFCIVEGESHPTLSALALRELDTARKNAASTIEGWGFFPANVKRALVIEELSRPLVSSKQTGEVKGWTTEEIEATWEALSFVSLEVVDIYPFRDYPPS